MGRKNSKRIMFSINNLSNFKENTVVFLISKTQVDENFSDSQIKNDGFKEPYRES